MTLISFGTMSMTEGAQLYGLSHTRLQNWHRGLDLECVPSCSDFSRFADDLNLAFVAANAGENFIIRSGLNAIRLTQISGRELCVITSQKINTCLPCQIAGRRRNAICKAECEPANPIAEIEQKVQCFGDAGSHGDKSDVRLATERIGLAAPPKAPSN
jgi:hypothetical protein